MVCELLLCSRARELQVRFWTFECDTPVDAMPRRHTISYNDYCMGANVNANSHGRPSLHQRSKVF